MAPNANVSHAEIWDDSLLVNSWNEALAEYEKYHSIHARGEKVEDVLDADEEEDGEIGREHVDYEEGQVHDDLDDPHAKRNKTEETVDLDNKPQRSVPRPSEHERTAATDQTPDGTRPQGPALPANLIGQVHDEGLKNLLMSWYYAGYYTGLYEGQQQGSADKYAKHQN